MFGVVLDSVDYNRSFKTEFSNLLADQLIIFKIDYNISTSS